MKTIQELRRQIESYKQVLSVVNRPYRTPQDEVTERLVSRLLHKTTERLETLEQRMPFYPPNSTEDQGTTSSATRVER